jgi:hypothetical protein
MQLERPYGGGGVAPRSTGNLADILERVLDRGVVVAGDIVVNLLDIELLTIKLRLLIASADTAREMGISWWENDPFLTGGESDGRRELSQRLDRIESALAALTDGRTDAP